MTASSMVVVTPTRYVSRLTQNIHRMFWRKSSPGRSVAVTATLHAEATPMTTRSTISTSVIAHTTYAI